MNSEAFFNLLEKVKFFKQKLKRLLKDLAEKLEDKSELQQGQELDINFDTVSEFIRKMAVI